MKVTKFKAILPFGATTYVIENEGHAAVIDPSANFDTIKSFFADKNISFDYVILTHGHFDHMLTIDEWSEKSGAEILISEQDSSFLRDPNKNCYAKFLGIDKIYCGNYRTISSSDTLKLASLNIKILETPGHTEGSITLLAENAAFVGDLIVANSVGRCDLPGGNYSKLLNSLKILTELDRNTVVYPGHGSSCTISDIKNR